MNHIFIDANSVKQGRSVEYLARPRETEQVWSALAVGKISILTCTIFFLLVTGHGKLKTGYLFFPFRRAHQLLLWMVKPWLSLLVTACLSMPSLREFNGYFPGFQQHKFCVFGPHQFGHQLVQKHSVCECRICNSLHYSSGQKCLQEETKPDIHASSSLTIKAGGNKKDKQYQEKAACKRPCIKVGSTNTLIGNHSRSSKLQTRLNQHQCRMIWGSE